MTEPTHDNSVSPPQPLGIDMPLVFTVATVSTIMLGAIVLATIGWYHDQATLEREVKSLGQVNWALQDQRGKELTHISTYRWIDQPKNIAAIPIDQAIDRFLSQNRQPAPPIKPTVPQGP